MKQLRCLLTVIAFGALTAFMLARAPVAAAAVAVDEAEPAAADAGEQDGDDESEGESADEADKAKDNEDSEPDTAKKDEPQSSEDSETKADADSKQNGKSEEKEKSDAKPAAKKRKTHKVEPKRLKIDITLDGTFVARQMKEVALRPETWSSYEIDEVVDHGAKVNKGETLIKFDSEKIDEAIADLELAQRLNELAILKAEEELPRLEKTLKLDMETAERASQQAQEDFERYKEIERPLSVKTAEFMVKYYDFMLSYERDELEQLEKMYEADDLTEETEEIVLKRQRNSVEFAQFSLEHAKVDRDEMLNVRLPRMDIRIKESLERTALARARAQTALSFSLNEARYELEQRKKARVKSLEKHADLLRDRELMEIKAPAEGIVFYGQNVNGRWSDTQTLINKYNPHSSVTAGSVLMTIVEKRPVFVTSTLQEGKRPDVRDGQKVKIAPPADNAERIPGKVKSISTIPVSPGKFEINFTLDADQLPDWIVPGMSCKVHITTYNKKDALVVPKGAVHDDEDDEDQKYVWLVDPEDDDAKPKRRDVKIGKKKGDDVEIVEGLKKGDVISLEDESKDDKKQS